MSATGKTLPILNVETEQGPFRRFACFTIIAAAAAVAAGHIANAFPLLSANDRSRWCTVWSLVEEGTYAIDGTQTEEFKNQTIAVEPDRRRSWRWVTIDRVTLDGHYYSSKPPLLATIVAGIYWTIKQTLGWDLIQNTEAVTRLTLFIVNFVPFIVSLVIIWKIVERYARNDFGRIFVVATAAFGTFLSTFLVALNNHTIAAFSIVFAIYPALRILADGERNPLYFALAGFFAGFACTNELPAALFGAALFALLVMKLPSRTLLFFVPAAVIPLAALVYTNYLAVGTWRPSYVLYGTEAYTKDLQGRDTHWANPKGIDKGDDTPATYLMHCTVGHHGIFSLSPVFLLSIGGWMQLRRERSSPLRQMLWLGLLLTPAIIAFYLTRTENYNYGGMTSGLRWAFWLIPFWLIAIVPVFERYGDCWRFRTLALAFLLISAFSAAFPVNNPWQHPWLFKLMERWEWIDYSSVEPPAVRPASFT